MICLTIATCALGDASGVKLDMAFSSEFQEKTNEGQSRNVTFVITNLDQFYNDRSSMYVELVNSNPEIATVGKTEEQLKEAGVEYIKGICPYGASGRAMALGETQGRVKILADAKTDRVLGVHIIGARAGDLIAEATAAIEFGASSEDVARTCHAHPTLSELLHEAAMAVSKRAIHTA